MSLREFELIQKIKSWIPRKLQGSLPIGDDAGLLKLPKGKEIVFTSDAIVEDVDFIPFKKVSDRKSPGVLSPREVGRKALAINLSDLAAMGAKPLGCVISLGLPENAKEKWVREFYQGLIALAKEYRVACVGGDISQSEKFFASISLIGTVQKGKAITRGGAKPGDWIGVTGGLGGSLLRRHAYFTPRIKEAGFLTQKFRPTAMMDISDGLLQDLDHLLEKSKTGAELEMSQIPISQDAVKLAKNNPLKALERAFSDGEDFELLLTIPSAKKSALSRAWQRRFPGVPLSWIGRVIKPRKVIWMFKGRRVPGFKPRKKGYRHFQ